VLRSMLVAYIYPGMLVLLAFSSDYPGTSIHISTSIHLIVYLLKFQKTRMRVKPSWFLEVARSRLCGAKRASSGLPRRLGRGSAGILCVGAQAARPARHS
jgi:hypothetical protein